MHVTRHYDRVSTKSTAQQNTVVDKDQRSRENFTTTLLETPTKIKLRMGSSIDRCNRAE